MSTTEDEVKARARALRWAQQSRGSFSSPCAAALMLCAQFDTSVVPWWAWVRRFHLPEAERINGRAAMIGFATGYFVDALTGAGLVDQARYITAAARASVRGLALTRRADEQLFRKAVHVDHLRWRRLHPLNRRHRAVQVADQGGHLLRRCARRWGAAARAPGSRPRRPVERGAEVSVGGRIACRDIPRA